MSVGNCPSDISVDLRHALLDFPCSEAGEGADAPRTPRQGVGEMRHWSRFSRAAVIAVLGSASVAWADFSGQTILGPLVPGSVVAGDTTGATDDNDGFTSGMHIFNIWNGPDDVWSLNWPGGDLAVQMTYDNTFADLDLFLYTPGNLDDSGIYSILNTGVEHVELPGAVPGTYYLVVDSPDAATAGAYTMTVPEPSMLALLGLGALLVRRRRV
jgi:MYXO-CTERM domain-containing protein